MHIAVVSYEVPYPGQHGGAMTCWGVLACLLHDGHRVTVVLLDETNPFEARHERAQQIERLVREPVTVVRVRADLQPRRRNWLNAFINPTLEDFYPSVALAADMQQLMNDLQPDAIFAYDFRAMATLQRVEAIPRLGIAGSWDPLSHYGRWRYAPIQCDAAYLRMTLGVIKHLRHYRFMVNLLQPWDAPGHFAAHHAEWLRRHGVRRCRYYRTPLVDPIGSDWFERRQAARQRHSKPKILLVGRLGTTLTMAGLSLLARDVLPRLKRRFGRSGFEVHLIGKDMLPPDLARAFAGPSVFLRGYVEDIDEEVLSSDVLLVPNPIPFSVRVRILVGFSYGCGIVTHRANALGIPELVHGSNALIGDHGPALAHAVGDILEDQRLQDHLGRNARLTYERSFALPVAGAAITQDLVRLVGSDQPHETTQDQITGPKRAVTD